MTEAARGGLLLLHALQRTTGGGLNVGEGVLMGTPGGRGADQ